MTYCVGLRLNKGLVFMSDTRTNAGVDDIATVKKMHSWNIEGERVITLMSAGNLATTQAVVSLLDERSKLPEDRNPSIFVAQTMFQVARLIGETLKTPFFQIGETKYGRPILVRAQDPAMSFEDAVKLLLVSFDSTIKANLSVGLPIDMMTYETDTLKVGVTKRFERDNEYFSHISGDWGQSLKTALKALPDFEFDAS